MRIEVVRTYSLKGYNFISISDPQNREIHETSRFEMIHAAFEAESVRICYNDFSFVNQNRNSAILIDNIKVFRETENRINAKVFKSMGLHIVILLDGNFDDVHEIFENFWIKSIFNIIALMNNNGTLLLSFEPFADPQNCGDTSPKVINRFLNGKFVDKLNLKKTFDNMNRCPITVTTFVDPVAIMKESFANGSFILRGHEVQMIKTISKMLNFTLNLKFREGLQQWGIVYENGTCTKAFKVLNDKKTDILLGNLYLKESRCYYFDNSATYLNYPVFLVLSPQEKLSSFEKLLSPLQTSVWLMVLLTIGCGIVVIMAITLKFKFLRQFVYGEGVHYPVTNLFTAFIGLPQPIMPKMNFSRFILMMFMMLSLVLRSIYQGSLYKFLQSDGRQKEPKTIAELIEKDYTFITSESSLDMIKKYNSKMYTRTKPVEDNAENDLDAFAGTAQRTASFASKLEVLQYSMNHSNFPYKICKEHFVTINVAMFFNKNFFLKRAIDEALQKILVHGFMKHWMKEFDRTDKWNYKDKNPTVLTVEHLSGAFQLLLIGNVCGLVVILVEIMVYRLKLVHSF
ncbi:unnamed protein product [Chironomus riparius]|uniref:Putative ionotropic receptor ligand binding domain-containing protein n=1 Tax=Chironomus riparius TaxID=315576 RepID=A0A9N9RXR7_9DIPT|nr:unnamed protein product [Chironomus riparius]